MLKKNSLTYCPFLPTKKFDIQKIIYSLFLKNILQRGNPVYLYLHFPYSYYQKCKNALLFSLAEIYTCTNWELANNSHNPNLELSFKLFVFLLDKHQQQNNQSTVSTKSSISHGTCKSIVVFTTISAMSNLTVKQHWENRFLIVS